MIGVQLKPGSRQSTMRIEMPLSVGAAGAVRATAGGRAQRGEIGASAWLAVAHGEMAFTGENLRQEEVLLLLGAVFQQRRPDRLQSDQRIRHLGARRLVDEDLLFHRAEPAPAVLFRPAD